MGWPNCCRSCTYGQHDVHAGVHDAERAAGEHGALVVEPAHEHVDALALLGEHVFLRHRAVLEHELAGVRAAHAELVELLRGRESLHALFDQERGDAARPGAQVGLGVDDERVGVGAVGDPHLGAVENVAALGARSARRRIETTSEPDPGSLIASAPTCSPETRLGKIFPLLRLAAVAPDLVDAEVGVRAVRQADRRRGAADLLHRDDVRQVTHRGAAVFLLDGDAEQADVAHLAPQVRREDVVAVDLRRARRDLAVGELLHRRAQHVDGLAKMKVQCRKFEHRILARALPA